MICLKKKKRKTRRKEQQTAILKYLLFQFCVKELMLWCQNPAESKKEALHLTVPSLLLTPRTANRHVCV